MDKIDKLIAAMQTHEGWHAVGNPHFPQGTRSYRQHNPLNLRTSPSMLWQFEGYAVFATDAEGWLAAREDIIAKATGNTSTGLTGESTLEQFINVWAPPGDNNDTQAYVQAVLTATGFAYTMKLKDLLTS